MADEKDKIIDITEKDIYLVKQQIQRRYVKFVIMNRMWKPTGQINGRVISGNISIDATNNIRRTASLEMYVNYESMDTAANFSMQNYLQLWCGIQDNSTAQVYWYNHGMYVVSNNSYKFDAKSRTLTLSLTDLMTDLNGDRGGVLHEYNTIVKNEQRIDTVMANVLKLCGYTAYDIVPVGAKSKETEKFMSDRKAWLSEAIEELKAKGADDAAIQRLVDQFNKTTLELEGENTDYMVPYDLTFGVGVTGYEILDKLVTLYPYYRMRFNVDGVFICDETVLEHDESLPLLTADNLDSLVISEDKSIDWTKVKNHIEVWGKDGLYYGEASDDTPSSPFNVNSVITMRAVYSGDVYDNIYDRYKHPDQVVNWQKDQAKYEAEIAELRSKKPISDDEKAEIRTKIAEAKVKLLDAKRHIENDIYIRGNDMAKDYADKLLYENCRINDSLTLQTVFLPFLNEVDFKIQHRTNLDLSVNTYVLKSVSHDLKNGTSTLNAVRFYDETKQSELVQLDPPVVSAYAVDGMTVTISVLPVEHATSYILYADFNVVEISNGTTFAYTMSDSHEGIHNFYVTASATAFRESDYSEIIKVTLEAGVGIIDESGNRLITQDNERILAEK